MGKVRLHHDGAPRCQRRSGIAACDREGQREVGGAEHDDGADGDLSQSKVGLRRRLTRPITRVEAQLLEPAVTDFICK